MFDTEHKPRVLFWRIESPLASSAALLAACRAGIDFLAVETGKAHASNGFSRNGAGGARESSCRPRETENPSSVFAKVVPYV